MMIQAPVRRRLGCLPQLVLLALLLVVGYSVLIAITHPWIYIVGGRFRMWPVWQGVGEIEGPGGNYRVFVSLEPSSASSRVLPSTSVRGTGWICTPSGQSYSVRVGGGAHEVIWRDMNGKAFTLYTWQRTAWSTQHLPPKLSFVGRWDGPGLVMDDKGTMAAAFRADGSLNSARGSPGPKRNITFLEKPWWIGNPCRKP